MLLLTWNPRRWSWDSLGDDLVELRNAGRIVMRWSCGQTRRIEKGERFYLMRLGVDPKGLVGSGYVTRSPFELPHWDSNRASLGETAYFVEVEFDQLAAVPPIRLVQLEVEPFSRMSWTPQSSGVRIPPDIADALEVAWARETRSGAVRGPDENVGGLELVEGGVRHTVVNAYERNGEARRQCLAHYGSRCFVCEFSFGETYGAFALDYMHVHHVVPVSAVKESYVVDPIADLRPLCPNCHAAIHLTSPLMTPAELRNVLRRKTGV